MKESPSAVGDTRGVYAFLEAATDARIALTALKVSAVVGTILNVINQSEHVMDGNGVSWGQFVLNFIVPYCVSSYSAARNELRKRRQLL